MHPMSTHHPALGTCPNCETAISAVDVLIEYETDDGPKVYADCPGCRGVVHPA